MPAQPTEAEQMGPPPAYDDASIGVEGISLSDNSSACGLRVSSEWLTKDEVMVMAEVEPQPGTDRPPADIVCVVDVSGSMCINASVQNEQGGVETVNLCILDIVKHAVRTIIGILKPTDRLGLVAYSTAAQRVLDLTYMDEAGVTKAKRELDKLTPDGQTNLWGGLQEGLDILRDSGPTGASVKSVLLLTDGEPNIVPPRGHIPMLQRYQKNSPGLACTINTFGFGYRLDSKLLRELAIQGNGMYSFIPDSGFVGTAFVNVTSNLLVTAARDTCLTLAPSSGVEVSDESGEEGVSGTTRDIPLGSVQFGQTRTVVFRAKVPQDRANANVELTLRQLDPAGKLVRSTVTLPLSTPACRPAPAALPPAMEVALLRQLLVRCIGRVIDGYAAAGNSTSGQALVTDVVGRFTASTAIKEECAVAMLQDLTGQVTEALSKEEWMKKWGRHYLPSLQRAHQLQQCANFKDPGLQHYGGALFQAQRDEADEMFCKLPPPQPAEDDFYGGGGGHRARLAQGAGVGNGPPAAPRVDMRMFHNRSSGCFAGHCGVLLADGTHARLETVKQGDVVKGPDGETATVVCVIETRCEGGREDLVRLPGGAVLTPYHPVRLGSTWHFPCELEAGTVLSAEPCAAVYNLVLDRSHVIMVEGVACVTLGHDFQEAVVAHPYFGSDRVLRDLENMVGWRSGRVVFDHGCLYKDPRTGLVAGFDPAREVYEGKVVASGVATNALEPMVCVVVTPAPLAVC